MEIFKISTLLSFALKVPMFYCVIMEKKLKNVLKVIVFVTFFCAGVLGFAFEPLVPISAATGQPSPKVTEDIAGLQKYTPVFYYVVARTTGYQNISISLKEGEALAYNDYKYLFPQFFESRFLGFANPNSAIELKWKDETLGELLLSDVLGANGKIIIEHTLEGGSTVNVELGGYKQKTNFTSVPNYEYIHLNIDFPKER